MSTIYEGTFGNDHISITNEKKYFKVIVNAEEYDYSSIPDFDCVTDNGNHIVTKVVGIFPMRIQVFINDRQEAYVTV